MQSAWRIRLRGGVVGLLLSVAVAAAGAESPGTADAGTAEAGKPVGTPGIEAGAPAGAQPPRTVRELIRRVERWVVAVRVKRSDDLRVPRSFRPPVGFGEAASYFRRPEGWVTGLLVDAEGHVLTSFYNVGGTLTAVEVALAGGERHFADLVAVDRMDDLALLRIRGDRPPGPGPWTDPPWASGRPRAGKIVFAVGRSPDPVRLTVTEGIVSARGRNGDRAFQTDAKLNYGNVGGPLVDLDGRIVGVSGFVGHTYPQWGLNSGIGFGTSTAVVLEVLPRLREGKDVEPPSAPFLGVKSDTMDFGIEGARIGEVLPDGAARKAGLRDGDIIVELAGRKIAHFNQLRRELFDHRPGDVVKIVALRDGEEIEIEITLEKRPERRL